jgi:hypothetical protein
VRLHGRRRRKADALADLADGRRVPAFLGEGADHVEDAPLPLCGGTFAHWVILLT